MKNHISFVGNEQAKAEIDRLAFGDDVAASPEVQKMWDEMDDDAEQVEREFRRQDQKQAAQVMLAMRRTARKQTKPFVIGMFRRSVARSPRMQKSFRRPSRTAVGASSPGGGGSPGGDSGGSEPPQGDPDLPSFRFVRSGLTHSYLKSDRFIPSWRPGRLGPMSHALLRGWSR